VVIRGKLMKGKFNDSPYKNSSYTIHRPSDSSPAQPFPFRPKTSFNSESRRLFSSSPSFLRSSAISFSRNFPSSPVVTQIYSSSCLRSMESFGERTEL
jgi:hypothetical protein